MSKRVARNATREEDAHGVFTKRGELMVGGARGSADAPGAVCLTTALGRVRYDF